MYVSLSIESNFSNALNDIDVVCRSILLSSLKILLLISPKWTLFEGIHFGMVQEFVFFP
jgi:hypothetical protein